MCLRRLGEEVEFVDVFGKRKPVPIKSLCSPLVKAPIEGKASRWVIEAER